MSRGMQVTQPLCNQTRIAFSLGYVLLFLVVDHLLLFSEAQVHLNARLRWFRTIRCAWSKACVCVVLNSAQVLFHQTVEDSVDEIEQRRGTAEIEIGRASCRERV